MFVCVGVHGGLGLPEAGSRSGGRARGHLRVCARCWAARGGGSAPEARTGEDAQLASCTKMWLRRQPHVPVMVVVVLEKKARQKVPFPKGY